MEGSIKAPVSVASQEEVDLESALNVMGMIPVGGGDLKLNLGMSQ